MVIDDVRQADQVFPQVVLTVGSFDGVHLGHQEIVHQVVAAGTAQSGTPAVMTMRPHPRQYFAPHRAPNLLTTDAKKVELLGQLGVELVYFLPFDTSTVTMTPETFVEQILVGRCHVRRLYVGHDFRFGKGARGDFDLLKAWESKFGYEVIEVPPLVLDGERVSSTLIRERVLEGDLAGAERFLGRKYSIVGRVIEGRRIGAELGFPTANLRPDHSAVPAHGVYVAEVIVHNTRHPAAVNIGIAPTIRHEDIMIEAHVLNFSQDIRGEEIEVVFHKRLRPEQKFASREELMAQIGEDVAVTRRYFGC
jgi:riboflavin kinase / FMN adenylyltransferase